MTNRKSAGQCPACHGPSDPGDAGLERTVDGEVIRVEGVGPLQQPTDSKDHASTLKPAVHDDGSASGSSGGEPRAAAGTDLQELDRLGMRITFAFEKRRLENRIVRVLPGEDAEAADALVVDVSSPTMISAAIEPSTVVKTAFEALAAQGISRLHPGFDILTIRDGEIDRMIELKSSGVDSKVQAVSWNEWKSAKGTLRDRFWLYLVGNLRADLPNTAPFVRAVQDPFGTLASSEAEDIIRKRTVQLRVREFAAADQLTLEVRQAGTTPAGEQ